MEMVWKSLLLLLLINVVELPGIAAAQNIESAASDNVEYGSRIEAGGSI